MTDALDREGLRQIIRALTDLTDKGVFWGIDPNPTIPGKNRSQIILDVSADEMLGIDEHRTHLSDGNDGYPVDTWWVEEIGTRQLFITMRAETFDLGQEASALIDRVRTGIRAADVADALNAIGLAFVWCGKTVRTKYRVNDRTVNCAIAEFEFSATAKLVSKVFPPGQGWIEHVNGNNQIPGTFGQ